MYVFSYVCGQVGRYVCRYVGVPVCVCMDGWTDGQIDGWMDEWMGGGTNEKTYVATYLHTYPRIQFLYKVVPTYMQNVRKVTTKFTRMGFLLTTGPSCNALEPRVWA